MATGLIEDLIRTDDEVFNTLKFSSDGKTMAVLGTKTHILEVQSGKVLATLPSLRPDHARFGPGWNSFVSVNNYHIDGNGNTEWRIHSWDEQAGIKDVVHPGNKGDADHHVLPRLLPDGVSFNVYTRIQNRDKNDEQSHIEQWNVRTGAKKELLAADTTLPRGRRLVNAFGPNIVRVSPSGRLLAVGDRGPEWYYDKELQHRPKKDSRKCSSCTLGISGSRIMLP